MTDYTSRLQAYQSEKLIDIVKNYRQYGYEEDIRNAALKILESRGVSLEDLELRGDLNNKTYDEAKSYYDQFEMFSKKAFLLYGISLLVWIAMPVVARLDEMAEIFFMIGLLGLIGGYLLLLIKSFISQFKYYKVIGKAESQLNAGLYFTVGMVFYIVMFFIFRKQMKDDINLIR